MGALTPVKCKMLILSGVFLAITYTPYIIAATTKPVSKVDSTKKIKYPGPVHDRSDDQVHESCKDLTYCTIKPGDYPEEKFNDLFKGYKSLPQPKLIEDLEELDNRLGKPNEESGCQSKVTYDPLYIIRPKRSDPWSFVVQAPKHDYVQHVRLEICSDLDAKCFTDLTQSLEYTTFCKQKMVTWEVLVYKGGNDTEKKKIDLPICCSCHYRAVDFLN